jgi:hypothetical protein
MIKKITVWATNKYGEGRVQKIGEYEEIDDISILCGHFSPDVEINFEVEYLPPEEELEDVNKK